MSAPRLTIGGRDVTGATAYDVTVDVGRADIEEQPDGSVMQARVRGYVDSGELGEAVVLSDVDGLLFHGNSTDLKAELEEEPTPDGGARLSWWTSVTATGPLAALGHTIAGEAAYPAEPETDRIRRVLDASGIGNKVLPTVKPFLLLPRPAERAPSAEIARKAATDGMGILWENPADTTAPLRYTPHDLRKWNQVQPLPWSGLPPDLAWSTAGDLTWSTVDTGSIPSADMPTITLDPGTVPARVTFEQTIADLVRTVTVTFGAAAAVLPHIEDGLPIPEPERPTVTRGDDYPSEEFDTDLAEEADAERYAESMLRRHREPAWRLSSVSVDLARLPEPDRRAIRAALLVGARMVLQFPHGSPVGPLWQGFLEGWRHTLTGEIAPDGSLAESHRLELNASERRLTEAAETWADASPAARWADTGTLSWSEALDAP